MSRPAECRAVFLALYCAFILYTTITAFDRPTPWYHAQVSYQLVLAAALLFMPFLLFPALRSGPLLSERSPWLAVALCLVAATVLSADSTVSVPRLRLVFGVLLFALVVKAWLDRSARFVTPLLFLSFAFVHAAILTLALYAYSVAEGDLGDYATWLPYHSHIRHLGYHGAVAACCGLAFGVLQPRFRLVGALFSAYALFGLIYFGSRGALLTWVIFVFIAALFSAIRRPLLIAAVACAAVAWGGTNLVAGLKTQHIGTVADRSTSTASVGSRLHLWTDSVTAIARRPLLGYGPEGYQVSNCCAPGHVQAHNAVLQILIETGVIGLAAVLWLGWATLGKEFIRLFRQGRAGSGVDPGRALTAALIVSLLAYSMIDGVFYHVVPLLIFALLCALLFAESADAGGRTQ